MILDRFRSKLYKQAGIMHDPATTNLKFFSFIGTWSFRQYVWL